VSITFFMSIMFPTIFAIGIQGVGRDTKSASSFIIMSIVGGAIIPPLASVITDNTGNIHLSYSVVFVCFVIILLFGWYTRNVQAIKN